MWLWALGSLWASWPFSLLQFYPGVWTGLLSSGQAHGRGVTRRLWGDTLLSMRDTWSQRAARGLRGETGPCMKLEGQISVCASSYEHAHAAVCTWRSENNLQ